MPHTGQSPPTARGRARGKVAVFTKRVNHPGTAAQPFLRPSIIAARLFVRSRAGRILTQAPRKNPTAVVRDLDRLVKQAAFAAQRRAQQLAAVDTGRLKGSINVRQVAVMQYTVGTNVVYAVHVEFGTRPHIIRPVNKKVLHFMSKRGGNKRRRTRRGRSRRR
ncbi:hypothetical protein LCGC14_0401610 [marine sediment metagenome]|uniref:Uncharacterized protein n=1 Tax=marine sediment metagenome TaxID=412755 RepID=A0A0F9W5R2_9ZZZZ